MLQIYNFIFYKRQKFVFLCFWLLYLTFIGTLSQFITSFAVKLPLLLRAQVYLQDEHAVAVVIDVDMGGSDSQFSDNSSFKKHQKALCIFAARYYGTCSCTTLILSHSWKTRRRRGMKSVKRKYKKHRRSQLFSIRGAYFPKDKARSTVLRRFGLDSYALLRFTGQQYLTSFTPLFFSFQKMRVLHWG